MIPEFFYKPLYDEKHRALFSDTEFSSRRFLQKGIREHLLCQRCESFIGKIERRVSRQWKLPEESGAAVHPFRIDSYADVKLLLLAILWRASVSSSDAFSQVSLERYEMDVRDRIRRGDPGPSTFFPIIGRLLVSPDDCKLCDWLIMSPTTAKLGGFSGWTFIFGGLAWFTTPSAPPLALRPGALSEIGSWPLPVVELSSMEALDRSFAEEL